MILLRAGFSKIGKILFMRQNFFIEQQIQQTFNYTAEFVDFFLNLFIKKIKTNAIILFLGNNKYASVFYPPKLSTKIAQFPRSTKIEPIRDSDLQFCFLKCSVSFQIDFFLKSFFLKRTAFL